MSGRAPAVRPLVLFRSDTAERGSGFAMREENSTGRSGRPGLVADESGFDEVE
jgi:hypothetical protein